GEKGGSRSASGKAHTYRRISSSAAASAPASGNRCSGFLAKSLRTNRSSGSGIEGTFERSGGGSLLMCIIKSGTSSLLLNGSWPVNISYATTPSEYKSETGVTAAKL